MPSIMNKNIIYYTSTDGKKVTPCGFENFGANILSNTYLDGQGKIIFDKSVIRVGMQAFFDCTSLSNITIPDSITSIGLSAFAYCIHLSNITIPNSVTNITDNAFFVCTGLINITIPNSVISIGNGVFWCCTSLPSITIPESVTSIGFRAFYGCIRLSSIKYNGTMEQWSMVAKGADWNQDIPATVINCADGDVTL